MGKKKFKGSVMLNPGPVVMVSLGEEKPNIFTVGWTGIVNTHPPMTYISVRPERHSYDILKETGEFVINLVTEDLAKACDYCGVKSGRDVDKWKEMKLTKQESSEVGCPSIKESPLNMECVVRDVIHLGTHDMFLADIVSVGVDEDIIDEDGRIRLDQAKLVAWNHGEYFGLKREPIGKFGYSIMKSKTRKRINREKRNKKSGRK